VESALRPAGLKLIETFRWEPEAGFVRLPAHLARLAAAAAHLRIPFEPAALDRALGVVEGAEPLRVRLALAVEGDVAVTAAPLGPVKPSWTLCIARERLDSGDPWLRLKSTQRRRHDAARAALPPGVDEALLLNERSEVCEGTITNVFADLGHGLVTPPLACGLLPGVLRAELLARGECRERVLRAGDLAGAPLFVGNSLRGLIPVRLAEA
jgi:4-amino-4-deoxychorismate lyase